MARTGLDEMSCSIARTLEVIGDAWTPLILRDIALGITRFDAIQRDLGISRKVLSERLAALVEHGVLTRAPYQEKPARYDYRPTEKGADLAFVLLAMQAWGNRWASGEAGPPILLRHETCGALVDVVPSCSSCGGRLPPAATRAAASGCRPPTSPRCAARASSRGPEPPRCSRRSSGARRPAAVRSRPVFRHPGTGSRRSPWSS